MTETIRPMILQGLSQAEILGLTIIGEARGEPIDGQIAVGCVPRNRLRLSPWKYHSYTQTCLEAAQFSCWNGDDPNYSYLLTIAEKLVHNEPIDRILKQCIFVATGIVDEIIVDITRGATNYITKKLFDEHRPSWARNPKNVLQFGSQVFFSL